MKRWLPPFTTSKPISIGDLIRQPSVEEMREHVNKLLEANPSVIANFSCKNIAECKASRVINIINALPITDEASYSAFLHEMGHMVKK